MSLLHNVYMQIVDGLLAALEAWLQVTCISVPTSRECVAIEHAAVLATPLPHYAPAC
jgi:hypothetical protein